MKYHNITPIWTARKHCDNNTGIKPVYINRDLRGKNKFRTSHCLHELGYWTICRHQFFILSFTDLFLLNLQHAQMPKAKPQIYRIWHLYVTECFAFSGWSAIDVAASVPCQLSNTVTNHIQYSKSAVCSPTEIVTAACTRNENRNIFILCVHKNDR